MKARKSIWNLLTTLLLFVVLALAILLAGVRLVGLTPYVVLSGSMEPTYPVGSLIYVKQTDPADIREGDAITFRLHGESTIATHRVIAISPDGTQFTTQGDANDAPDGAPVLAQDLVGRPLFAIPYLGYLSHWITNPPGRYLTVALLAALVALLVLPDWIRRDAPEPTTTEKRRTKS